MQYDLMWLSNIVSVSSSRENVNEVYQKTKTILISKIKQKKESIWHWDTQKLILMTMVCLQDVVLELDMNNTWGHLKETKNNYV